MIANLKKKKQETCFGSVLQLCQTESIYTYTYTANSLLYATIQEQAQQYCRCA